MTTFEHALLGINGSIACGFHRRRSGWKWVATAGLAAIAPDWDGLPMLVDMSRFESGHRVWGHNVLACAALATLISVLVIQADVWEKLLRLHQSLGRFSCPIKMTSVGDGMGLWAVAFTAALSQIPADAVVSGGKGLSDWPLKPLWPFSDWSIVYPMVPWGNVGVTLIFAVGMIAMAKRPRQIQTIAIVTLMWVVGFIVVWGYGVKLAAEPVMTPA